MATEPEHTDPSSLATQARAESPWDAGGLLPEPPANEPYGYLEGRSLRPCSRDELAEKCRQSEVSAVWTPDQPRLLPATEVAFLVPALEGRLESATRHAFIQVAFGLAMSVCASHADDRPIWPFWLVTMVAPGLQGIVDARADRSRLRRRAEEPTPWPADKPARFAFWVSRHPANGTKTLAAAVAIVALSQVAVGLDASVAAAGLVKNSVRSGQVWRLLSAGMLHGNAWHLLGNLGALLALGRLTEGLAHWSRLAIVYLWSIPSGSLFSLFLLPQTTSVGASGGLMGLLGFLLVLAMRHAKALPPRFAGSLANAVAWIAATGVVAHAIIDNAAHLGGLLCGLAFGVSIVPRTSHLPLAASRKLKLAGAGSMLLLLLVALACVVILLHSRHGAR